MKKNLNIRDDHWTGGDQEKLLLLFRYIEKEASASEREQVEQWLNEDPILYQTFKMTMQEVQNPPSAAEMQAAAETVGLDRETVFSNIQAQLKKNNPQPVHQGFLRDKLIPKIRDYSYRISAAAAAILVFLFGGNRAYVYLTVDRPNAAVQQSLAQSYRIHIDDPRLAGGYYETGVGDTMSLGPSRPNAAPVFDKAEKMLKGVLRHDHDNEFARRKLTLIYAARPQPARRDSLIEILRKVEDPSPALLNDLGVYAIQEENWPEARQFFERAREMAESPLETKYNLALVLAHEGRFQEAEEILKDYLRSESREGWQRAARRILQRIQRDRQK